jgi:hypothetical protein
MALVKASHLESDLPPGCLRSTFTSLFPGRKINSNALAEHSTSDKSAELITVVIIIIITATENAGEEVTLGTCIRQVSAGNSAQMTDILRKVFPLSSICSGACLDSAFQ